MFASAMHDNLTQIRELLEGVRQDTSQYCLLDLGCGSGENVLRYAPNGSTCYGVEVSEELAEVARKNGIDITVANLDGPVPLPDETFDAVTSNQVLEHLADTDAFVSESFRLVRPGGIVVHSTENLSSWHNIAALVLGWQAFSLTNVSTQAPSVGNPIAIWRGTEEPGEPWMQHRRVFSYRGLLELMAAHGFVDVHIRGAGYYPLSSSVAHTDPRHAAFLTVAGRRPLPPFRISEGCGRGEQVPDLRK
jgi:SAM-dependent methyltransferase